MGIADFPVATLKALAIHPDNDEKKAKKAAAKKAKAEGGVDSSSSTTTSQAASSMNLASSTSRLSLDKDTPPSSPGTLKRKDTEPDDLSRESTLTVDSTTSTLQTTTSSGEMGRVTSPRSSLAEALRNLPEGSRPRSPSRNRSPSGFGRSSSPSGFRRSSSQSKPKPEHTHSWSESSGHPNPIDTAYGTGKGITKIVGAGFKSPMDLLLGVSKGFHNLPKLYGEEVRQTGRVTGLKSGLQTAGKVCLSRL
jgi:hypothetical protein